jgi:hypothetical protein
MACGIAEARPGGKNVMRDFRLPQSQSGANPCSVSRREPNRRQALYKPTRLMNCIQERLGPIYEVMKNAARSGTDVEALYARAQNLGFSSLHALAAPPAERGPLRTGLSVEDASRTVWVLASPKSGRCCWRMLPGPEWYTKSDTLSAALLPPPDDLAQKPGSRQPKKRAS